LRDTIIKTSFRSKMVLLSLFFIFVFPKAGFYHGLMPISFSYIFMFVIAFFVILININRFNFFPKNLILLLLFFLNIVILLWCYIHTSTSNATINPNFYFVALNYSIVPVAAFSLASYIIKNNCLAQFRKVLIIAFYFVMIFGVIQFIFANMRHPIGIPYLTMTGENFSRLLYGKDNNRGFIIKGFSTYGNGNLYGVCIALWGPLVVYYLRDSIKNKTLFYINMIITFSRTVWVGLFFIIMARLRLISKKYFKMGILMGLILLIFWVINGIHRGFLIDPTLGGRIHQFYDLHLSLFPQSYSVFYEITYLDVLQSFGIFGLIAFVCLYFYPLCIRCDNDFSKVCKIGIFTYLVMMCSDGVYYLIPVGFIFWFVVALMMQTACFTNLQIQTAFSIPIKE